VQVNADRSIWIKWQRLATSSIVGQNADEFLIPNRTDCLTFLSTGLCRGQGQQDVGVLQALNRAGLTKSAGARPDPRPGVLRSSQLHAVLQDLERRRPWASCSANCRPRSASSVCSAQRRVGDEGQRRPTGGRRGRPLEQCGGSGGEVMYLGHSGGPRCPGPWSSASSSYGAG
jgi:hypothetical protein